MSTLFFQKFHMLPGTVEFVNSNTERAREQKKLSKLGRLFDKLTLSNFHL
jgi:hypothetical protein